MIADYDDYICGLTEYFSELSSIDELNYLALFLTGMFKEKHTRFQAILEYENPTEIADLINYVNSIDCIHLLKGINNTFDLGYYLIEKEKRFGNVSKLKKTRKTH